MSTIGASGAIESTTPRQIAGARSAPKSVRKLMTGRSMARDRSDEPRIGPGIRSGARRRRAPLRSWLPVGGGGPQAGECGGPSGGSDPGGQRDVDEAVVGAEAAGSAELAQEEQAIDVGEAPGPARPDLDAGQVGSQVGRLAGREATDEERPIGRPRRGARVPVLRGHRTCRVPCPRAAGDVPVGPVGSSSDHRPGQAMTRGSHSTPYFRRRAVGAYAAGAGYPRGPEARWANSTTRAATARSAIAALGCS